MSLYSKIAIGLAALIVILVIIFFSFSSNDNFALNSPSPTLLETDASISPPPSTTKTKAPTISPTAQPTQTPRPKITPDFYMPTEVPRHLITGPATCSLRGKIEYVSDNIYKTLDAKISYQNVDDPNRFIFWKIEPDDGALTIGPNVFFEFVLPNGEKEIGVSLNKSTTVKVYNLTAYITYGFQKSSGEIEVRNADCTGKIAVTMP